MQEGNETVIYVELLKALYGTMRAARLFWEKLSKQLVDWGFKINPYDRCVANKMINGTQCTVAWHVDDVKISHVEKEVVDRVIHDLETKFGKEAPLSKSRGKVHDYLGMILDFSVDGELRINMIPYIKMVLAALPSNMRGRAATPAASYLYKINNVNPVYLDEETVDLFHSVTMQLMYLAQRGRPDTLTAVSFLSSRVQQPDTDDYKKLARVTKYLDSTQDLVLRLAAASDGTIRWWVDASYAVHPDMRGHTGGTMSLGSGSVYSTARKQKIVTRSSTECELVGVYDVLPQMEWTRLFLQEQGYTMKDSVLYQDNMSAMLLEKNGKASSSKRTKHIHMRYFYVKDKVDSGELRIEHCPTKEMLADFFTKPLQGALFRTMRDRVMNIDPNSPYYSAHRSVLTQDDDTNREDVAGGKERTDGLKDEGHKDGHKDDVKSIDDDDEGWILVKRYGRAQP